MTRPSRAVFLSIALAMLASTALAQIAAEGTIRGYVKDEQGGVLPGVTLTATTPARSTSFTAMTGADGFYRLINLPPGVYTIVSELAGFSKFERSGLEVRAELNIQVDVTMKIGSVSESIQVSGETPMLEVQKTVQAVNISGDFQRALPLSSRREWSDSLALTPGIMSRSTDQFGGEVYFLRGTENENHVVQIDGGDVGSFEQNWPGFFARLNTEAISDTQVKTAGVDAASPLAVGMVINIATPSGTNQLRGSAAAVYTAKAWNGDNNPGGTPVAARVFQPDVAVGGPVVKDRAWFFASMRHTDRSTGVSRDATLLGNLNALVPNFQPFDNQGHLKYYFVKGTTQLSPNHQMYVYVQRDANSEEASFQVDSANFEVSAPGGGAYTGRLTSVWGSRMTTRLLAGYNTKGVNPSFSVFDNHLGTGGPSRPVHPTAFISGGVVQGSGRIAVLDNIPSRNITPASKLTFSADMTYFHAGGRAGSHEIQIGTYLQPRLEAQNTIYYSGGGFALEELLQCAHGRQPAAPCARQRRFRSGLLEAGPAPHDQRRTAARLGEEQQPDLRPRNARRRHRGAARRRHIHADGGSEGHRARQLGTGGRRAELGLSRPHLAGRHHRRRHLQARVPRRVQHQARWRLRQGASDTCGAQDESESPHRPEQAMAVCR